MHNKTEKLDQAVHDAVKLHGHLGPFLIIGVRMGKTAQKNLNLTTEENQKLNVTITVPLNTPFSCTIDGIQTTTGCTVGNQKLKVKESQKEISAKFEPQTTQKSLCITVNPDIIEDLMKKFSENITMEELTEYIAEMPETQLFIMERH